MNFCQFRVLRTVIKRSVVYQNQLRLSLSFSSINSTAEVHVGRVNHHGEVSSKSDRNRRNTLLINLSTINVRRKFMTSSSSLSKKNVKVLGIETSCDDTGAAVVDGSGNILGDSINRQTITHLKTGGIIPNVAKEMHAEHVERVVQEALDRAGMDLLDVDGIAVTLKPGLAMSLRVGLIHAQKLAHIAGQQLIPIHHMEAHALTARMINKIDFPFLVLLTSGGHCLLAVARDVDDFLMLGTTHDDAPGDAFDKTARELRLNSVPGLEAVCGGAAIEKMAESGDPDCFPQVHVMTSKANCDFSFTGLKAATRRQIREEYRMQGLEDTEVLPNASDLSAWFQYNATYHLARRLQRAFIFTELRGLITQQKKTLVMSGGVASNMYIRRSLEQVCDLYGYHLVCPPQHLCTDNGIMIAWNGVEKILANRDCFHDPYTLQTQPRSCFGADISNQVFNSSIKLPRLKIKK